MVKIKNITTEKYNGVVYDLSILNAASPYYYANNILTHNSLYPHIFMQCNLYSAVKSDGWNGNNFFKVSGTYNNKEMGKVEMLFKDLYALRKEYKRKKDMREQSIKVILNSSYGISGNPAFKHLYNPTTASDCTLLARQWIKLARQTFRDAGYKIVYTDTDSWYFIDELNDEQKVIQTKDNVINLIKSNVPFPQGTFDADIDYRITDIWFFKGKGIADKETDSEMDDDDFLNKPKGLMKKNYIFLTTDGNVVVKNLGVRKKSTSALTRKIFWDYLVPKIKSERKVRFPKEWFEEQISELLKNDLSLASKRYSVSNAKDYKLAGQIQTQIANKYGHGIHFLIPNYRIGVGKGKKYCTIDEFNANHLNISDIDLTGVWNELEYFIETPKVKTLFEF